MYLTLHQIYNPGIGIRVDLNEPNWNIFPLQKGAVIWYCIPKSLANTRAQTISISRISFCKVDSTVYVEKCVYFALDI